MNVELSPPGGEEWICVSIGGRKKSTHWRRSWCHLWPCYTFDSWNKHITGKFPVVAEVCNDKLWATPPPGRYLLYKASNGFSNSHIYPVSLYLVVLLMQLSSLPLNSRWKFLINELQTFAARSFPPPVPLWFNDPHRQTHRKLVFDWSTLSEFRPPRDG